MVAPTLFQQRLGMVQAKLAELCRRHHLRELSIFGSVLRDDFGPDSDIDVLIELEEGQTMTIERFLEISDDLEGLFHRKIDLVEKQLVRNPYRRREILGSRQVMYAA